MTRMLEERPVIHEAHKAGIKAVVDQQFEVGEQVLSHGLVPIIEPEVSIGSGSKKQAEAMLRAAILEHLETVSAPVMLKLTLPEEDGFYAPLVAHPKVVRVVALSGGYDLAESCRRLAANPGVIASFSRALIDGLSVNQSAEEFDAKLDSTIGQIAAASNT